MKIIVLMETNNYILDLFIIFRYFEKSAFKISSTYLF